MSYRFRHATRGEKVALGVCFLASMLHGCMWPVWSLLFGEAINKFGKQTSLDELASVIREIPVYFVIMGAIAGILAFTKVRPRLFLVGGRQHNPFGPVSTSS